MHKELRKIALHLHEKGAKAYLVGGAIRDLICGKDPKDLDIEVFGLGSDALVDALKPYGRVSDVGGSFSVIKLYTKENHYDFSLPRRERKVGRGYRGFAIKADPTMTPKEAASRRDYTFNALMMDLETDEILDFFGGEADLKAGVLRHVGPAFAEDPVRVLRGFQFASRFNLRAAPQTAKLCQELLSESDTFPVERIWGEWYKWALKSKKPSAGLQFLVDTGWVEIYPEIKALLNVPQDAEWHPEGDVFVHTKHVVDAAAAIANRENITGYDRVMFLLASLIHDFGKPATTEFKNGRWRSHKHAKVGAEMAPAFLEKIATPKKIALRIPPLVAEHLCHSYIKDRRGVRKLSHRLTPSNVKELCWLIEADCSGRPPKPKQLPPQAAKIKEIALAENCFVSPPKPIVTGAMLLDTGFIKPGPKVGKLLSEAYTDQLKCKINNQEDAAVWVRERLCKPIVTGHLLLEHGLAEPGPYMGKVIKLAHKAQEAGEFKNEAGALIWLSNNIS